MAPEPAQYVSQKKICPSCKDSDCRFAYNNNYNEDQPRYKCRKCKCYFAFGKDYKRKRGKIYAKKGGSEIQDLPRQCPSCKKAEDIHFLYYNNNQTGNNLTQPRFKCKSCKIQFQMRLITTGIERQLIHTGKTNTSETQSTEPPKRTKERVTNEPNHVKKTLPYVNDLPQMPENHMTDSMEVGNDGFVDGYMYYGSVPGMIDNESLLNGLPNENMSENYTPGSLEGNNGGFVDVNMICCGSMAGMTFNESHVNGLPNENMFLDPINLSNVPWPNILPDLIEQPDLPDEWLGDQGRVEEVATTSPSRFHERVQNVDPTTFTGLMQDLDQSVEDQTTSKIEEGLINVGTEVHQTKIEEVKPQSQTSKRAINDAQYLKNLRNLKPPNKARKELLAACSWLRK